MSTISKSKLFRLPPKQARVSTPGQSPWKKALTELVVSTPPPQLLHGKEEQG
jgi:hypothetical protein